MGQTQKIFLQVQSGANQVRYSDNTRGQIRINKYPNSPAMQDEPFYDVYYPTRTDYYPNSLFGFEYTWYSVIKDAKFIDRERSRPGPGGYVWTRGDELQRIKYSWKFFSDYVKFVAPQHLKHYYPAGANIDSIDLYVYLSFNPTTCLIPPKTQINTAIRKDQLYVGVNDADKKSSVTHRLAQGWNKITFNSNQASGGDFKTLCVSVPEPSTKNYDPYDLIPKPMPIPYVAGLSQSNVIGLSQSDVDKLLLYYHPSQTPYIIINYSYDTPEGGGSLKPNNTKVNPRKDIELSWTSKDLEPKYELEYYLDDQLKGTSSGKGKSYTIPADTLKVLQGELTWRVRLINEYNIPSDWSNASVTIEVPDQEAPRLIYPVGAYHKNTEDLILEWAFIKDSIERQVSYELEYTIGSQTKKTIRGNTSQNTYNLGKISDSNIGGSWRVRVTNQYGQVSPWSELAKFQIYGVPPTPRITSVSDANYPYVTWTSSDQEMYKIVIKQGSTVFYDSGFLLGYETKGHLVDVYVPVGQYTFELYVKNPYNLISNPATFTKSITAKSDVKVEIDVFKGKYHLELRSNMDKFDVIRDGVKIGSSTNGIYLDHTCANGRPYKYRILTQDKGVVSSSDEVGARLDFRGNVLAPVNKLHDYIHLVYNMDELPRRSHSKNMDSTLIQLEGEKYPIIEYGTNVDDTTTLDFFVKDVRPLLNSLDEKQEYLYRDYHGFNIWGFISNIGTTKNRFGYLVTFTITKSRDDIND